MMRPLRTMLLAVLSCLWLSCSAFAHGLPVTAAEDVTSNYHIRRREAATADTIQHNSRDLNLLPSFSVDEASDESLVSVELPQLTMLFRGLDGSPLGDKSYDAIQTAMNDYLRKRFEDFFKPNYEITDKITTQVIDDIPSDGGNAISIITSLTFIDPNYDDSRGEYEIEVGPQMRSYRSPIINRDTLKISDNGSDRDRDGKIRRTEEVEINEGIPSEDELNLAAGYAWGDLTSFSNHLLVQAAIENINTFDGVEAIEALDTFTDNPQEAEDVPAAEEEPEVEDNNEEEEEDSANSASEVQTPQREDVTTPSSSGSSLNVAAASSALTQSETDRLNPLWPALIVGMAVFLVTIIVLGYRKHRDGRDRLKHRGYTKENVMIHINNGDSTTLEEEIEVEDTLYSTPEISPDRRAKKKKERDLDKEYAASCLKPATMVLSSSSAPSTFTGSDDEDDIDEGRKNCFKSLATRKSKKTTQQEEDSDGDNRKNCLKSLTPRSRSNVSLQEQDSMASRKVDLTITPDQSSWRNPAQLRQEAYDSGDLSKNERHKFTKYIESGLSIEEASSRIMSERKAYRSIEQDPGPVAPSTTTRTRSGDISGYSNPKSRLGQQQRKENSGVQSHPMDCFDSALSPCAEQTLSSDIMDDGTGVQYVERPSHMSLGDACRSKKGSRVDSKRGSRSIDGTARAMVITEASSYASSYDDDDFDRAMEEAGAETAMI